jgi:hypothetical protein
MRVIADLLHHPDRHPAMDLLVRAAAIVLAGVGILGLLPLIAELAS